MFARNAWYVAASMTELADRPLGRQICGERLVLHCGAGGEPVALEDWCPHRGAPLSLGRVVDSQLVCGYHGLVMGCQGRAVSMPGQRVNSFPTIRRFPCVQKAGFAWVWPGDPEQADPRDLPDLPWADDPAWAYGGGLYHVKADYRLMIDNLMDLTHETYVHADSIGQAEIDETPCHTTVEGEHVTTSRWMEGVQAPPFWRMALRENGLPEDAPVDRWQRCHFTPPSHVLIEVGVALAGRGGPQAAPEHRASAWVVDFITPESDTSMWYFWGMARNFRPGDAALTERIREGQGRIFAEDLAMLEQQQRNLERWPGRRLLRLNIDAGGVHARRLIERRIAAEQPAEAEAA